MLPPALGGFRGRPFVRYDTTLFFQCLYSLAPLFPTKPRFSPQLPSSPTDHTQQPSVYDSASNKKQNMSQYNIDNSTNLSNNTSSFNVHNNYVIADDRSQLLTWLSPLDPRLRHRDIQGRRVDNVGEWLFQTEEFRTWYERSEEDEGDKAVLFCYGGPGVGKTFIR